MRYSTKAPQVANGQSLQPTNFTRCAAAVPWLLACSGLRGKDRGRSASGTLALARRREPLRPHFGLRRRRLQPKRQRKIHVGSNDCPTRTRTGKVIKVIQPSKALPEDSGAKRFNPGRCKSPGLCEITERPRRTAVFNEGTASRKRAITAANKFYALRRCGAVAPRVLGSARQRSRTARKRDACFCAPPRAAPTTFWLAAKTPPAKTSA
jgi:hypothetical protein